MDYEQILPTDPRLHWGHRTLRLLEDLWRKGITGAGVRVGVLDSAPIPEHPDLHIFPKSQKDFTTGSASFGASQNHGCHCCGAIAAAGSQVFGAAPEAGIAYGRVKLSAASVAEGLEWLLKVRPAVHIICIPLEIFEENEPISAFEALRRAIAKAEEKGKVVVAAVGNDFDRQNEMVPRYPAAFDTVLAIGALKEDGNLHEESGMHSCIDLVAPGHMLLTTEQGGGVCTNFSRTSAAAAFAAGAMALVVQVLRDHDLMWTAEEIRKLVKETADFPFTQHQKCQSNLFGCGIIQPAKAVQHLLSLIP